MAINSITPHRRDTSFRDEDRPPITSHAPVISHAHDGVLTSLLWSLVSLRLRLHCCRAKLPGSVTRSIESSLRNSRLPTLKRLLVDLQYDSKEAVQRIIKAKCISIIDQQMFLTTLQTSLDQICGYKEMKGEVERLRKQSYCSEDVYHEKTLLKLWDLMKPKDSLLSRVSNRWTELGFQGHDPATDFRGMGLLSLENLVYLAHYYPEKSLSMLSKSCHPNLGYSYAIVGINLTSMAVNLLNNGSLKTHFYNKVNGRPNINDFHEVYCNIFMEFDAYWYSQQPEDIMQFNRIRNQYEQKLTQRLREQKNMIFNYTDLLPKKLN